MPENLKALWPDLLGVRLRGLAGPGPGEAFKNVGDRAQSRRIWLDLRYAPLSGAGAQSRRTWLELRYNHLLSGPGPSHREYGLSLDTPPYRGPVTP